MSNQIYVYKHRDNVVRVDLGTDISSDTFLSQIRSDLGVDAPLLATWTSSFETDGTDGILLLELSDTVSGQVVVSSGYMDIRRESGTKFWSVLSEPLGVVFIEAVSHSE